MAKPVIDILAGKYRAGDAVLEEGPGAEILGDVRKYLELDSAKWIYLNTATGNDANTGLTVAQAKRTPSAAAALVNGTTYTVVHVLNDGAVLTQNITKPFQMAHGMRGRIDVDLSASQGAWFSPTVKSTGLSITAGGMCYSPTLHRWLVANGANGTSQSVYSDDDGVSWNTTASIATFGPVYDLQWLKDKYVGCWRNSFPHFSYIKYSTDGITAPVSVLVPKAYGMTIRHGAYSESLDLFVFVGEDGIYVGKDVTALAPVPGYAPSPTSNPLFYANFSLLRVIWSFSHKCFITVGVTKTFEPLLLVSYDGYSWERITVTTAGTTLQTVAEGPNGTIAIPVLGGGNDLIYTNDLRTFSTVTANNRPTAKFMFSWRYETWVGYNSLLGGVVISKNLADWYTPNTSNLKFFDCAPLYSQSKKINATVGNNNQYYEYGNEAIVISDDVAGFHLGEVRFSGSPELWNCSRYALDVTSEKLMSCRADYIKTASNAFVAKKNLAEIDWKFTSVPASQDAVVMENNVIGGNLIPDNASATYYERLVENVIFGQVRATNTVLLVGGFVQGGVVNCVLDKVSTDDPGVTGRDYIPKREILGYEADSPMVAKSELEFNSIGVPRDVGAWSYREENVVFRYRRHFQILKPSKSDSIKFIKHLVTSANPTAGGKPSVVNIPQAAWEELVLAYGSVSTEQKGNLRNQFEFLEYMQTQEMLDIQMSWDGADAIVGEINLTATAQVGDPMITVAETDVEPGRKFVWFGTTYIVLRVSGNRLILDRDILDEIPNATEVPLVSPTGYGEYTVILEKDPTTSLNHFAQTDYRRGMTLRMARKCV